jgi:hypothetical protein
VKSVESHAGCHDNHCQLVAMTTIVNWLHSPELHLLGEETFCVIETDFTLEKEVDSGEDTHCGAYKIFHNQMTANG